MTLTPSQRVQYITEISRRLGTEGWAVIDLTLRQFGFTTTDDWRGGTADYVLNMVESGFDAEIAALAAHVGIDTGRQSSLQPPFWTPGYFRLFIGHSCVIKDKAGELQAALGKFGISGFVAHNDIEPTKEWQSEIELALATCDSLVALLTPEYHASKWTDQEIGYAMGREVLVFSIRLGQDPYGFIGKYQGMDGSRSDAAALAQKSFDIILANKLTGPRMRSALVSRFEQSSSFQAAREAMGYLESCRLAGRSQEANRKGGPRQLRGGAGVYCAGPGQEAPRRLDLLTRQPRSPREPRRPRGRCSSRCATH
jgi:hypothetical protein